MAHPKKGKNDFKRLQGTGGPILLLGNQRMHGFFVGPFYVTLPEEK
ncbi:MAG: hypothetical protein ABFR65_07765 [Pseudomonadota bacterium]